jgi:two-component system sensor histidine kinase and response regulator WspE
MDDFALDLLNEIQHRAGNCRHMLAERMEELEEFDRRSHNLASRLNREVIASRMRPFADGIHGFQRMVRDIARSLEKQVKLEIHGLTTKVDRDILEKIEAPLNHLIRNALDHGIETPAEREAAGKPAQAHIRLEAMHSSGMLSIIVEDDGRGMDLEKLREKIVKKKLVTEDMARELSESELMDFIFLPGFSTREQVSEISGRGVGLDVVHSVVQEMHGIVHAISNPGKGMRFHLQLPLTLSVMRSLMVEIAGEIYAFPLSQINRTLKLNPDHIETLEGRQYFTLGNQHIGLLAANQVLGLPEAPPVTDESCIVVLGERLERYGFVVDRFLGERSLVVHPLDPRLGKVKDISAASILESGDPCLIIDVDDMLRSADILIAGGRLDRIEERGERSRSTSGKRILVVDDSITVREVERNMLTNKGYDVEVAVDGMDGWNAVRTGHYDLVISDIDMPRMNGFEFVEHIKGDPTLRSLPVMIVSYKDREEDRARGLEVGADYYLTKGSFQDETLLDAVADLIGDA